MYSENDSVDNSTPVTQYINSVPLGNGEHEVVREYKMEVFEKLVPTVRIFRDAAQTKEIVMTDSIEIEGFKAAEITINAGESLYFRDATGEDENGVSTFYSAPSSRSWVWECLQTPDGHVGPIPTVKPFSSEDAKPVFTFDEKGCYRVTMTIKREKPEGYSDKFPEVSLTQKLPIIVYAL